MGGQLIKTLLLLSTPFVSILLYLSTHMIASSNQTEDDFLMGQRSVIFILENGRPIATANDKKITRGRTLRMNGWRV